VIFVRKPAATRKARHSLACLLATLLTSLIGLS
ncbi:hypothetical protein JMJ77_0002144, partial [Colletotrichum scovillei]